jgi:hypothetical protein
MILLASAAFAGRLVALCLRGMYCHVALVLLMVVSILSPRGEGASSLFGYRGG